MARTFYSAREASTSQSGKASPNSKKRSMADEKPKPTKRRNGAIGSNDTEKTRNDDDADTGKKRKSKKKLKQSDPADEEIELPITEEWNNPELYKKYKSFKRVEGESIYAGQYVALQGIGSSGERERWVACVKDIRARAADQVFITVAWCYNSIDQMREYGITNLPKRGLADRELVLSSDEDIVSVWTVHEPINMRRYDDTDPWQADIELDDEYYRAEIVADRKGNKKLKPIDEPQKKVKPYMPLPLGETPMIYCPNSSCRKWFHLDRCKAIKKPTDSSMKELVSSGLELLDLRTFPPDSARVSVSVSSLANTPSQTKAHNHKSTSQQGTPSKVQSNGKPADSDFNVDPITLITAFAHRSITRGQYSIVGNAKAVLEAREILNLKSKADDVDEVEKLTGLWMEKYGPQLPVVVEPTNNDEGGGEVAPQEDEPEVDERYLCPDCGGVI